MSSNVLEVVKNPTEFTMYETVNAAQWGKRRIEVDAKLVSGEVCLHVKTNNGNPVILTFKQWRQMNREVERMFAETKKAHDKFRMNRAEV